MRAKRPLLIEPEPRIDSYEALRRLKVSNLVIRTIPGEEWTLSVSRHKTLLVDVYTLTGTIAGTKKPQTYRCGRLAEILVKLLRYGRKAQYHSHTPKEGNLLAFTRYSRHVAETLEEDALHRLRGGDIIFKLIPGESWRLTNTWFGHGLGGVDTVVSMFHLAEESTLGTPNVRMYKGLHLEHVLLDFLLQHAEFVEPVQSRIIEFAELKLHEEQE